MLSWPGHSTMSSPPSLINFRGIAATIIGTQFAVWKSSAKTRVNSNRARRTARSCWTRPRNFGSKLGLSKLSSNYDNFNHIDISFYFTIFRLLLSCHLLCNRNKVLNISDGIDDLVELKWDLALTLFVAWCVVYFCIMQGIKTSGKVK